MKTFKTFCEQLQVDGQITYKVICRDLITESFVSPIFVNAKNERDARNQAQNRYSEHIIVTKVEVL